MTPASADPAPQRSTGRIRALARVLVGSAVLLVVLYTYALRIAVGDVNPFNFFGYFTGGFPTASFCRIGVCRR